MADSQPNKPAKKYLEIKPEDAKRIAKARARDDGKLRVDTEWLTIAEFGKHFGYAGVRAILDNEIDGETMTMLLLAARKVDKGHTYDMAQASFYGAVSASAKKPAKTFEKVTKDIIKNMKADV